MTSWGTDGRTCTWCGRVSYFALYISGPCHYNYCFHVCYLNLFQCCFAWLLFGIHVCHISDHVEHPSQFTILCYHIFVWYVFELADCLGVVAEWLLGNCFLLPEDRFPTCRARMMLSMCGVMSMPSSFVKFIQCYICQMSTHTSLQIGGSLMTMTAMWLAGVKMSWHVLVSELAHKQESSFCHIYNTNRSLISWPGRPLHSDTSHSLPTSNSLQNKTNI